MWYFGFLLGCLYNLGVNGFHIGCCHTVQTVCMGCLLLGARTSMAFIPLYYLAKWIIGTGSADENLLAIILGLLSLVLVIRYSEYRTQKMLDQMTEEIRQEMQNGDLSQLVRLN